LDLQVPQYTYRRSTSTNLPVTYPVVTTGFGYTGKNREQSIYTKTWLIDYGQLWIITTSLELRIWAEQCLFLPTSKPWVWKWCIMQGRVWEAVRKADACANRRHPATHLSFLLWAAETFAVTGKKQAVFKIKKIGENLQSKPRNTE